MKFLKLNQKIATIFLLNVACVFPLPAMSIIKKCAATFSSQVNITSYVYFLTSFRMLKRDTKYMVPEHIKLLLDEKKEEFNSLNRTHLCRNGGYNFSWLPLYIIKDTSRSIEVDRLKRHEYCEDIIKTNPNTKNSSTINLFIKNTYGMDRLEGHEYCENIIKKNQSTMNLLEVPTKYYYSMYIEDRLFEYVIAEKVDGCVLPPGYGSNSDFGQLSLEQTKQLCDFIVASGWHDVRRDNYALRANGRISIIDTERECFKDDYDPIIHKIAGIVGLESLLCHSQQKYICSECVEYVEKRVSEEKKK